MNSWYVLMKQVISFSECVPSEAQKIDDQYKSPRSKTGVKSTVFKILGVRPSRALPVLITTHNWALVFPFLCFLHIVFFRLFTFCCCFNRSIYLKKDEEKRGVSSLQVFYVKWENICFEQLQCHILTLSKQFSLV